MNTVLAALVLLVLGVNIAVSVAVINHRIYEASQKWFQIVFVWLVPVVGAVLVWHFLREDAERKHKDNPYPDHRGFDDGYVRPYSSARRSSKKDEEDASENTSSGHDSD